MRRKQRDVPRGYAAIALYHPQYKENLGSVLRAMGCFDAALLLIQGRKRRPGATDTHKEYRRRPCIYVPDITESIPHDCVPVAVEIVDEAIDLRDYVHPERALYVFGPENGSLPRRIVERCRDVVKLPTNYCMNLAACVNTVLYDRSLSKQGEHQ